MFAQAEVQRRTVAQGDVAQRLDGLVVFHDLDAGHVLRPDVVCRQRIASVEQVHSLDVELVDGFAVVADFARLLDLDARHLAQYVGDGAVLCLGEACHVVAHRVAPQREARRADFDLANLHGLRLEANLARQPGGRVALRAVAHHRDLDAGGPHPLTRAESEGAVGRRGRVAGLPARAVGRQQDGPGKGPSVGGVDNASGQLLGCGCDRKSEQRNDICCPLHASLDVIRVRWGCSRAPARPVRWGCRPPT